MIERALVHVDGPKAVGKTTFIERILEAHVVAFAGCVRAERDAKLRKERESAPRTHGELSRYRRAGASAVALYRFPEPDGDAFFATTVMANYSEAVFIEGRCPLECVDISVFVAPPPQPGRSLLRRVSRDHIAAHRALIAQWAGAIESHETLAVLLGAEFGAEFGESLLAMVLRQPDVLDDLRRQITIKLDEVRRVGPPPPTESWALEEDYEGIERAQLVMINVKHDTDRASAEVLAKQIARLRKDEAVFCDVAGHRSNKVPIMAVVADLSKPNDRGLKKGLARIKRTTKRT